MAGLVVLQLQPQPSSCLLRSSLRGVNGTKLPAHLQFKKKTCPPGGASLVKASNSRNILIMGGTRFIGEFLSRLLFKEGHQVTLFARGKTSIAEELRGKSDKDYVDFSSKTKAFAVLRRTAVALLSSSCVFLDFGLHKFSFAEPSIGFREYIDTFDGYSFKYPQNWIQVRGAGADIFFRDPYVLDENISVELSSPSSSHYKSVEDLGSPEEAGKKVLRQYLTEFMSTRLGVRRESNILSTSSRVADDGKMYYQIEVNIKSYANNNELAVMPQDRVPRLEWNRRYLSVLGVENNRLYELRLQTPEKVFVQEESDLRRVMDSFRVNKVTA